MSEGVPIYGKALAELRLLRCMSQDDLSNATEVAGWRVPREMISVYERGKKSPTPQTLAAIAKALELSRVEMRALVRTPTLDAVENRGTDQEDQADRRAVGKLITLGGLSATLGRLDSLERILTHGDRQVDAKLIAAHEDIAGVLAQEYRAPGGLSMLPLLTTHADIVLQLLDRPCGVSDRARLETLAVTVSTRAGARALHGDDRLAARKYLASARVVADDSGDHTLLAQALGKLSVLYSPLPSGRSDRSDRAIELLDQAVVFAARADRFTRGWVSSWRAEEAIAARDGVRCRQSLETADRALAGVRLDDAAFGPTGPIVYGVQGQLLAAQSLASALYGEFETAERQLADALPRKETTHQHVIMLTQLASIRIDADNPEGACHALGTAAGLARAEGYTVGVERIRGVRARFPDPWEGVACVSALDERLRSP